MKLEVLQSELRNIPHMTIDQSEEITRLIVEEGISSILELGFRHGVSTCYMAAALDEAGGGNITTIDLENARDASPNIEELLARFGLNKNVTIHYEPSSYLWRLMKMLEENPNPRFDFCYIDGAHSWDVDGFAFFLVDKLLKPGGIIIFDDLDWTFATSDVLGRSELVMAMPAEEKTTPQVRKVYELLVKTHPAYGEFIQKDDWAYARKLADQESGSGEVRTEVRYQNVGIGEFAVKASRQLAQRARRRVRD